MNARLLVAGYLAILAAPLALSWLAGFPPRSIWDELASGAGMLAFTIILVEFILSGRFRPVSSGVGMDVTMRVHQLLARTALVLAVVHPVLYRAPMNPPRPWDTSRALTITSDFTALSGGILAFLLLPALIAAAIGRSSLGWRYETWRLLHGIGALVIAAAVLHHTLNAGRYSLDPMVSGFWAVLFAGAGLTLIHVYVVRPLGKLGRRWTVESVRKVALRTWHLRITPSGHAGLDFAAGQFVWLNVGNSPFSLKENPFSISSAPSDGPGVEFIIKELGDFTNTIGNIATGTRAFVDGPHGNLKVTGRDAPGIALLAGGVGIAPMIGILRELAGAGDTRPVVLVYGNRRADQIVLGEELDALGRADHREVVHVLSEPDPDWAGRVGMVDERLIRDLFDRDDRRQWLYVLCGPPPMLDAAERTLISLGVGPEQILSERFSYD